MCRHWTLSSSVLLFGWATNNSATFGVWYDVAFRTSLVLGPGRGSNTPQPQFFCVWQAPPEAQALFVA